jgi:hypothetical protein
MASEWSGSGTGTPDGTSFLLAIMVAALDTNAGAQVTAAVTHAVLGALLVPMAFAICVLLCSSESVKAPNACCCPLSRDDTSHWKGAAAAKLRFLAASYCFAQGLSLVAAAQAMPWLSVSADTTLPVLSAAGLLACDPSIRGTFYDVLCSGGKLATAGYALFYVSIVLGATAWIISIILTIRARNLAHHSTLPRRACCGSLPGALYVGLFSALLSLVGVILSWTGYTSIFGLVPAGTLKLGAPPGGVAAILGTLLLFLGAACLLWAYAALGDAPVPHMTGEGLFSCSTADEPPSRAFADEPPSRAFSQRIDLARQSSSRRRSQTTTLAPEPPLDEEVGTLEERARAVQELRQRVEGLEAGLERDVEGLSGDLKEVEARLGEIRARKELEAQLSELRAARVAGGARADALPHTRSPFAHTRLSRGESPSSLARLREELETLRLEEEVRALRARAGERPSHYPGLRNSPKETMRW